MLLNYGQKKNLYYCCAKFIFLEGFTINHKLNQKPNSLAE